MRLVEALVMVVVLSGTTLVAGSAFAEPTTAPISAKPGGGGYAIV
jgi:hypothetical protein